jgi:uncharacterized membrane protein
MSHNPGWQRAAGALSASLAAVMAAWHWLVPGASWIIGVITAAPLLIALPGLVSGRRYTYQWVSLALAVYAGYAVTEAVANPAARIWASVAVLLACLTFIAVVGRIRYSR